MRLLRSRGALHKALASAHKLESRGQTYHEVTNGEVVMRALFWILAVGLLVSCAKNESAMDVLPDLEAEFQSRYIQPYVAGDIDAWMQVFADDAVALHDGLPPLDGKMAIRGFGDAVSANFLIEKLDAEVDEVRRDGNWAWIRGRFVAEFAAKSDAAPPGVAGERLGKFLLLWERQPDGSWLVIMDMGNGMQAPSGGN
jgi:ketosteroid isomerase-like protein